MKQEFNWRDYDNYNEWLESVLQTLTENIEEKDKEIERLNNDYLEMKDNFRVANDEIDKLHSIIKEVREYLEIIVKNTPSSMRKDYANMLLINYKKVFEILKGE